MLPECFTAYLDLVKVLVRLSDQPRAAEEALEYLDRLNVLSLPVDESTISSNSLLTDRQFSEIKALKAEALAIVGDNQKSKEAYRLALDTDLVKDLVWRSRLSLGLSLVAQKLNEPELAIAAAKEVIHIEPENLPALKLLAEEYWVF